jgi:hypothetical protein
LLDNKKIIRQLVIKGISFTYFCFFSFGKLENIYRGKFSLKKSLKKKQQNFKEIQFKFKNEEQKFEYSSG